MDDIIDCAHDAGASAAVLAGSAVVIASGVFVVWRERRLGILEAKAKAKSADTPT